MGYSMKTKAVPFAISVASTTTPVATKAASTTGGCHFITLIVVQVDTAATTLTVKSGTTTIFTATLGIGTHTFPFSGPPECPGLSALAPNVLVSAGLSAGTAQQAYICGVTVNTTPITT
jgi:hypothetical protein